MNDADFGSAEAAAMGGKARAKGLSDKRRREIARLGGEAKAMKSGSHKPIPKASHEGVIEIGNKEIAAAVLENGQRVLNQSTFLLAIGRSRTPKAGTGALTAVDRLPSFLQAEALKPLITEEIRASTDPIIFIDKSGKRAVGYDAELLPKVAEVYLQFRDLCASEKKKLPPYFADIVMTCDLVMRGLARTGIRALVDEATGFQYERPRRDLQEYLKKFLSESLVRWARSFPKDYFKHLCRLKGVELRSDMRLPQYFGHLTNDLVYRRVGPGVLKALKERREARGRSSNKLHWWTSEELGHPELLLHLGTVVGLMKLHTDYDAFERQLDQIAPIYPDTPGLFDDPKDWEKPA